MEPARPRAGGARRGRVFSQRPGGRPSQWSRHALVPGEQSVAAFSPNGLGAGRLQERLQIRVHDGV